MAQQREMTTDRLVSVIANIKLERRSGQLLMRRGEGLAAEEGTLLFVRGQVTQANVGRRSGSDALNWLSTWKLAHYIFIPATSSEAPAPAAPPASSGAGNLPGLPVERPEEFEPARAVLPGDQVPYAIVALSEAVARLERAGFSRSYRLLYLLIDGRRSVHELVQLVGRNVEEVHTMLYNMERLGILQMVY